MEENLERELFQAGEGADGGRNFDQVVAVQGAAREGLQLPERVWKRINSVARKAQSLRNSTIMNDSWFKCSE